VRQCGWHHPPSTGQHHSILPVSSMLAKAWRLALPLEPPPVRTQWRPHPRKRSPLGSAQSTRSCLVAGRGRHRQHRWRQAPVEEGPGEYASRVWGPLETHACAVWETVKMVSIPIQLPHTTNIVWSTKLQRRTWRKQ
jgi:hypothetical protein